MIIKAIIRWFDKENHIGGIIGVMSFLTISIMIGIASNSIWLGIFAVPLLMISIFIFAVIVGIPLGALLYLCIDILPRVFARMRDWAYSE